MRVMPLLEEHAFVEDSLGPLLPSESEAAG